MKFLKIITVVMLIFLSSCKDNLTVTPENKTVAIGYYDSPQKIQQAVIGGYVDLRRAITANYAWLMYGEARTGDLKVEVEFQQAVADQKLNSANRFVAQITDWGYFYDVISDANNVLDIVEASSDLTNDQRNLFKGEALALKSISYFYLARIWGDVLSAEKNEIGKRLTHQEAVSLALGFANQAKGILPWRLVAEDGIESTALTNIRFNKTAVTSLLAQEQLWLGKAQDAYDVLSKTFTSVTVDSLSNFGLSLGADRRTTIPLAPLGNAVVSMPLDRFNTIYPVGDSRRTSMFNVVTNQNKATLILRDATVLDILPQREVNLLIAEAAWRSGRLNEAKASLIIATNGATEDYNALTETTFADALLQERRRMLPGTGQRMFDLIRFGKVSAFIPELTAPDVQNGGAYWPLSAVSIQGNSLSQNSYWLSKK